MDIKTYFPLRGFKNYEITQEGYVRRVGRIKLVKRYSHSGQLFVEIYSDKSERCNCSVADLVASSFLDYDNKNQYIEFQDRNSYNCKLENLVIVDILDDDSEWKIIRPFPKYEISINGEIRNRATGKLKSQHLTATGYKATPFSCKGKSSIYLVHRLVAEAFLPNIFNRPQVNHKDLDKTNNKLENLEWVTAKENMRHWKGLDYREKVTFDAFEDRSIKMNRAFQYSFEEDLTIDL
jgi:hypothetical protein